jgi:hypothetical protein
MANATALTCDACVHADAAVHIGHSVVIAQSNYKNKYKHFISFIWWQWSQIYSSQLTKSPPFYL